MGMRRGTHGCNHHHFMGMGMRGHMGMMHHGKWLMLYLMKVLKNKEELKLNDEQAAKLKTLLADHIRSTMRLKAEIQIAKFDLMGAFSVRAPDFEKIRADMRNIMNMKAEKKMEMIDALERSSRILTDEQKNRFMDLMCEWTGRDGESPE